MELDGRIAFVERGAHLPRDKLAVAVLEQACVPGDERRGGGSAENLPERHPGPLRGEVPERDVDRGEPEDGDPVAPEEVQRLLELAHEGKDMGRVAADQDRRHRRVDHRLDRRHAVVAERLSPADRPVLGLDSNQEDVECVPRPPAPGRRRPVVLVWDGEWDGVDAGDLHARIPETTGLPTLKDSPVNPG